MKDFEFTNVISSNVPSLVFILPNGKRKILPQSHPYAQQFGQCGSCSGWVKKEALSPVITQGWYSARTINVCPQCKATRSCTKCGSFYNHDSALSSFEGLEGRFCSDCIKALKNEGTLKQCPVCGEVSVAALSSHWYTIPNDANHSKCCLKCAAGENGWRINRYHSSKDAGNYLYFCNEGEMRDQLPFMGFELEVTNRDGHAEATDASKIFAKQMPLFAYYEHDCSIGNGVEIISNPTTVSYVEKHEAQFKMAFNQMRDAGFVSHVGSKCGLHVHIDKVYFGSKLKSATSALIYLFEKFSAELMRFSRRTPSSASRWSGNYSLDSLRKYYDYRTHQYKARNAYKQIMDSPTRQSRYHAVNVTNAKTIEIRLWRGTLDYEAFIATLRMTARLAELAKNTKATDLVRLTWADVIGEDAILKAYDSHCTKRYTRC